MMKLHGRVALITGGAQRLGRAIALALAEAGANLMLHYHRSEQQARSTCDAICALGQQADSVQGNLMEVASTEALVDATVQRWGRLDVLVCNAGSWGKMPLGSVSAQQWDELYALNARAPFFLAQRAAPHLRAAGGSMVAIADVGIYTAWKGYTPYLSSKAALAMVVHNLARDMAPDVRVNAVAPGPVLLPEGWEEAQVARAARSTLLQRVGSAEDIAQAVVYLACADYVTGVILPVDGGQRLH